MSKVSFIIKEKEYQLPEYLSIGDYQKIFKYKDILDDEYFGAKIINKLTMEFSEELCDNGKIDWEKLVKFNSGFEKIISKK